MRGFGSASITNNSRAVAEFRGDGAALDRLLAEARELLRRRTAREWFKELSGPDRTDESRTVALGYLIEQRGLTEILCGRIGHAEFAFTGCEKHTAGSRRWPKGSRKPVTATKLKRAARRSRYRLRKQIVEPMLGQLRQARGFRKFLPRGLNKVRGEWAMVLCRPQPAQAGQRLLAEIPTQFHHGQQCCTLVKGGKDFLL
jgi:hypothetical protein